MEYVRGQHSTELGGKEFSIGIWLGGESTPNTRKQALASLKELKHDPAYNRNQFVLTRCPWCGAQNGTGALPGNDVPKSIPRVTGYETREDSVALHCPDRECHFYDGLPVYVVDEDIYAVRPTLVIGTVDKFAMLAWRPQARSLFGIDDHGEQISSPPGLISG